MSRSSISLSAYSTDIQNLGTGCTFFVCRCDYNTLQLKTISTVGQGLSISEQDDTLIFSAATGNYVTCGDFNTYTGNTDGRFDNYVPSTGGTFTGSINGESITLSSGLTTNGTVLMNNDLNVTGQTTILNGLSVSGNTYISDGIGYSRTEVTTSTYTPQKEDIIIGILSTTGGSVQVNLPSIGSVGEVYWIFKDEGFSSTSNPITFSAATGNYIEDNLTTLDLSANGGSLTFYNNNNNNWYII